MFPAGGTMVQRVGVADTGAVMVLAPEARFTNWSWEGEAAFAAAVYVFVAGSSPVKVSVAVHAAAVAISRRLRQTAEAWGSSPLRYNAHRGSGDQT